MVTALLFTTLALQRTVPLPWSFVGSLRSKKHCSLSPPCASGNNILYDHVLQINPLSKLLLPSPSLTLSPNIYKSLGSSTKPATQLPDRAADLSADVNPWQSYKVSIYLLDFKTASKPRAQLVSGVLQVAHCTVSTFAD